MNKITSYLNLNDGASEGDIVNAIKERDNKIKLIGKGIYNARKAAKDDEAEPDEEPENALNALNEKVENLSKECDRLTNLLNAKTQECDALNASKKEAEDKMKESEAEDVINAAVNAGKISKEKKADWIGMYVADKDHTTNLLDSIGFVKKNPAIPAKPPTRNEVTKLPNEKNGIRQVTVTQSSDGESPFRKLQRERMEHAKEAAKNYKNK